LARTTSRAASSAWLVRLVALGLVGLAQPALAQLPVIPSDVKAAVQKLVDYGYCPALVVGVLNTNGTVYFGYGRLSLDDDRTPDENTLFEIGSITKVFTTTLLSDMAQKGELGLTDRLQAHLPEGVQAPTRSGKEITLTHLATHTSGLPRMPTNFEPADWNNPFTDYTVERMYAFLNTYTLPRNPGQLYEYSNYGMGLLGHVLERITGADYESPVVERIANELGLSDTRITLTPGQRSRLARGYSGVVEQQNWELGSLAGAGALRSSARDMLRFLEANRGWLASSLSDAMTETQRQRVTTPSPDLAVGLGWHLLTLNAGTAVFHDGATGGYRAFAGFLRNGKTAVVVLAGSDYGVNDLGFHLLDTSAPLSSIRQPKSVPVATLQNYYGRYEGEAGDHFFISLRRDRLVFQHSGSGNLAYTLYPSADNRFYATIVEASATFRTNATGLATNLVWVQGGITTTYAKALLPARLALQRINGEIRLTLSGDTGRDYLIEASEDLRNWTAISTNTIWNGVIVDAAAPQLPRRFYRAVER